MIELTSQHIQRINPSLLQEELDTLFGYRVPFTFSQRDNILEWLRIEIDAGAIDSILSLLAAHNPDALSEQQ